MTSKTWFLGKKWPYNIKIQLTPPKNKWNRLTESMRMLSCEDIVFEAHLRDLYLKLYLIFRFVFWSVQSIAVFCHFIAEKNSKITEKAKYFAFFIIRCTDLWKKRFFCDLRRAFYALFPAFFDLSFLCSSFFCYFSPVFCVLIDISEGCVERTCRGNVPRINQKRCIKAMHWGARLQKRFRLLLFLIFLPLFSLFLLLFCRKKRFPGVLAIVFTAFFWVWL